MHCCMAGDRSTNKAEDNANAESDGDDNDSACSSSDVTWGEADVSLNTDLWANDFCSDATDADDAEPFYDMN